MGQILHISLLVLAGGLVLFLLLVGIIDMISRIEWLHHRFPHLRTLGNRKSVYYLLLLVTTGLLLLDIAETWKWQPTPSIPRITTGSEPYKDIPTGGLAQMIDVEADKIQGDLRLCDDFSFVPIGPSVKPLDSNGMRRSARKSFSTAFLHSDLPDLTNFHAEAAKRLGPGFQDSLGEASLDHLKKTDSLNNDPDSVCQNVRWVLPYFKKMSAALRLQAASSP